MNCVLLKSNDVRSLRFCLLGLISRWPALLLLLLKFTYIDDQHQECILVHNVLKLSAIFSYSALPEHQSQNAAVRRYFARRQQSIICCYPLIDDKSDQRLLVMNGSVGKLKPIGERRSIIIPDNHLWRNKNLMCRPSSLGGMCAGAEKRERNSPFPTLLKMFSCEPTLLPCSRELRLNTIVTKQAMLS